MKVDGNWGGNVDGGVDSSAGQFGRLIKKSANSKKPWKNLASKTRYLADFRFL